MLAMYLLAFVAVAASGWWGRYDLPLIGGVAVGVLLNLTTAHSFHTFDGVAAGLFLAYLRRPIVHPSWPRLPL